MKYNLSKKLFTITLALLLLLMGFTLVFQLLFFQRFYEDKKVKSLTKEVNRFSNLYSYQLNGDQNTLKALSSFENRNNAKIAIFSISNGNLTLRYLSTNLENDDSLTSFCSELINDKDLINKVLEDNTAISSIFYNYSSATKKLGVVSPISLNSKNDSVIVVVSSIQPIEEAADVISEFYIYIFIGFIFFSIVLASIYSNLISKPLIKMNNVAKKMSNMDFEEKCESTSNDEIGNLANTLNFLSSNLESALEDLRQKNKQLELDIEKERNLELMRKDFIASVSHELKTPIGIIEGYSEGIRDGIVNHEQAIVYLDTIIDESKKMGILVNNMLELSKLESGVIKPKFEVFNINRLIKKVIHTLSINAEEKKLELKFIELTDYSYVKADIFKMEQVLTNLITNAIKYTPENNLIEVSIQKFNSFFKISVINYGTSIESNEIDKLFNKFYRIDKARQRNTNSTGLGLSIVKNILELHNCKFSLHNIKDGVEFCFFLPEAKLEE